MEQGITRGESPRRRILIADHDASSRALLRAILEGSGYDVTEASDGWEVLTRVDGIAPDLVVLDLAMPKLNGCGTAAALRRKHSLDRPIVALTAALSQTDPEEMAKAGFSAYLVKPLAPARLRQCVAYLLAGKMVPGHADRWNRFIL